MKLLILSLILNCTSVTLLSQNKDTLEILSAQILVEPLPSDIEWLQASTKQDLVYLDSVNIKVIAGDNFQYFWNSSREKSIECKNQVHLYKVVKFNQLNAYCLACSENGKVTHIGACITITP